jgi:hypothetical protein
MIILAKEQFVHAFEVYPEGVEDSSHCLGFRAGRNCLNFAGKSEEY